MRKHTTLSYQRHILLSKLCWCLLSCMLSHLLFFSPPPSIPFLSDRPNSCEFSSSFLRCRFASPDRLLLPGEDERPWRRQPTLLLPPQGSGGRNLCSLLEGEAPGFGLRTKRSSTTRWHKEALENAEENTQRQPAKCVCAGLSPAATRESIPQEQRYLLW